MSLLIRNAHVITSSENYTADIYCERDTITRIDTKIDPKSCPEDTVRIDAAGKYVFPGFIDPHVHIYLPFMGTYAKDTWDTASKAALVGGTTTLIEMICPDKTNDAMDAFEQWCVKAEGMAACDYTYHMGVTRFDSRSEKQLRDIVQEGITSFKVFLAYKGALGVDDRELYRALTLARELGVVVTAHCENETLVAERQAELLANSRFGPEFHEPSRPVQVEAEGVNHLMTFAELTGAQVYIVHTSCEEAVNAALRGRQRGVNVSIETVIPYLTLDKTFAERNDPPFEGAKYVMSPPLREKKHQDYLWKALRSGIISTVATDHAPFDFQTQKAMGKEAFTKIPNGIPSVENRIDLLYTYGVTTGKIDLHTFVDCASTQAARIFGLTAKGRIAVGADADLCIYDPNYRGVITAKRQYMATDYNAFEGWEVKGRPHIVTVRGQIMARDGQFVGQLGHGRLIAREPSY
jgi:dihydropyrimidinase